VRDMQIQYKELRRLKDFETIILMYERWSSICFDYKNKFLNFEYFKNLVNRKVDPILQPICLKIGKCFMCVENEARFSCNNMKDQNCAACKECSSFCAEHGYFCRLHAHYEGYLPNDQSSYLGNSCPMCNFEKKGRI
jgi:hypothetical protein